MTWAARLAALSQPNLPHANSADSAKKPAIRPNGNIGTIGAGIFSPSGLTAPDTEAAYLGEERAAVVAEGGGGGGAGAAPVRHGGRDGLGWRSHSESHPDAIHSADMGFELIELAIKKTSCAS